MDDQNGLGGSGNGSQNPGQGGADPNGRPGLGDQGDLPVREWMADLPEPLKKHKGLAKFTEKAELAKSYLELEGQLGRSIRIPEQSDGPEAWGKVYSRLGRPETPEGYEIPAGKLDASLEKSIRQRALAYGLNKAQAKGIAEGLAEYNEQVAAAGALAREQREKQEAEALKAAFGSNLPYTLEKSNKAFHALFTDSTKAAILASPLVRDPGFVSALADLADQLGEDRLVAGSFQRKAEKPDPLAAIDAKYGKHKR